MRRTLVETATPFLEPEETILAAVSVVQGSKLMIHLRVAAMLMSRFRVVAVTGANVYILSADAITGTRSRGVKEKHPLGSVEVRFEPGIEEVISPHPAILGIPGSGADQVLRRPGRLHVGEQTFWVRARNDNDAWAVANAATR
jgi:hypothetical protein